MSRTLFTNISRLHTFQGFRSKDGRRPMAEDIQTIVDAMMLVSAKGEIEWVGAAAEWNSLSKNKTAAWRKTVRKQNLGGREVLPAFTECHTHLLYAGSRADEFEKRNRGDSYLSIAESGGGIRSTVRATAAASTAELESDLISRLKDLAHQGVTTVEIKTGYAGNLAEENRHLNILYKLRKRAARASTNLPRVVITCLAAHSIPDGETEETWLRKVETLLPGLKSNGARLDIFIEKGAFSLERGSALLRKARSLGIDVAVHADQLSKSGGSRLGAEVGARSVDHVIEVGESEISELANSPLVAVLLPAADMYTRLPYPKARLMLKSGVRVALATDHNPGSSPGLDLALVGVLARTCMQMTLPEVLAAYTVNASAALGLGKLGVLAPKMTADFLVLQPGRGLTDLFYEVGPGRSQSAIESVWRDGKRLDVRNLRRI